MLNSLFNRWYVQLNQIAPVVWLSRELQSQQTLPAYVVRRIDPNVRPVAVNGRNICVSISTAPLRGRRLTSIRNRRDRHVESDDETGWDDLDLFSGLSGLEGDETDRVDAEGPRLDETPELFGTSRIPPASATDV